MKKIVIALFVFGLASQISMAQVFGPGSDRHIKPTIKPANMGVLLGVYDLNLVKL
jgi:hypothetical protein